MHRPHALDIAQALSEVRFAERADSKLIGAVRCLLFDMCRTIGETEIAHVLGDSWGGDVLRGMQEHFRARQSARRARAEDETTARKRRDEKKRLAQEKHQQRLTKKKVRDRKWREKQGKME